MSRRELSDLLDRSAGQRTYGSLVLSMQQEEGMAPLRKEIDILVEQFAASPELKASVKQSAERLAVKVTGELGPTKAAVASVAQEFLRQGRSMAEVSSCIAKVHTGMDQLKDLILEVRPSGDAKEVRVLVDGRERPYTSAGGGIYLKLRIPLFASDDGKLLELKGAAVTRRGYDPKRLDRLASWVEFGVRVEQRNFELFKVLKEARLAGLPGSREDLPVSLRKYSISKLPLTELLLKDSGLFNEVGAEYAKRYALKAGDGRGRSPRKLAEEALSEACEVVVPSSLSDLIVAKFKLKPAAVMSLLVTTEPADHWPG
ncbi:MAG: hypothetical protein JRN54_08260 [Nitrososphaerota archaeon]|jgi:hypothetical protein|nr:hypothetical protein [Nitrososphaerota archaeon]